jgi:flagellar biosynthesis anti-sigma factor FlgM
MKIQDHPTGGVAGAAVALPRGKGAEAASPQRSAAASDTLQFSDRSREIQRARSAALGAPEVRQELVDQVAGLVADGRYDVSGAQVAPRMIREHLADAAR